MQDANWHKWLLSIALLLLAFQAQGQDVAATLTVRQKQVEIGRPFEIELSVRHPERTVVVFPDSIKDFKPYEVASSLPIPTSTDQGISEDRKIYKVYTWEIDSLQKLQFPVRYLNAKGDTSSVLSNEVTVEFLPMIPAYNDSLGVKVIDELGTIREPVNWLAWSIIFGAVMLVIILLVLVFSKPIGKWLKRMRIEREFHRHLNKLEQLKTQSSDQPIYYPGLNRVWRQYFDRNWDLALGSMTTTELQASIQKLQVLDENDRQSLLQLSKATDMVLYAGLSQDEAEAYRLWEEVRRIMQKEYQRRKEAAEL